MKTNNRGVVGKRTLCRFVAAGVRDDRNGRWKAEEGRLN